MVDVAPWGDTIVTIESVATMSQQQRHELICRALEASLGNTISADGLRRYVHVRDTYQDRVVYTVDDRLYQRPYQIAEDGAVTFGEAVEVHAVYEPISGITESARFLAALESDGARGRVWTVAIIRAGKSGNGRTYPAKTLESAVPLFEGAQVYADHPTATEQRERSERSIRDVVGWLSNARWVAESEEIQAELTIVESAAWLSDTILSAWDRGKTDLLGLSINAAALVNQRGKSERVVESIIVVRSVDLVTTPAAGGRIAALIEGAREEPQEMNGTAPAIDAGAEVQYVTRSDLVAELASIREAVASLSETFRTEPPVPVSSPASVPASNAAPDNGVTSALEAVRTEMADLRRIARASAIRTRVAESGLPQPVATRLSDRIVEALARRDIDDAEIDSEIGYAREILAQSGAPGVGGVAPVVESGEDFVAKFATGIDGFFSGSNIDGLPRFDSLKAIHHAWNVGVGRPRYDPMRVGGQELLEAVNCYTTRFSRGPQGDEYELHDVRESLTTSSWGEVFADRLYKHMVKEYNAAGKYNAWQAIVSERMPVESFQTHRWNRVGGYSDIPIVPQQGTYNEFVSPPDEEVSLAVEKRGGIESITLEMLTDPTGSRQIRGIPQRLARAAARTLYKFVFNTLMVDNPTMSYDSVALFHSVSHGNTDTGAGLSVGTLQTARQKMRDQVNYGESDEVLGEMNEPRFLLVPNELQGVAARICNSEHPQLQMSVTSNQDTSQVLDPNMFRGVLQPIVIDVWTDANDWILVANPANVNTIILGFLGGREEPEMFVQDNPTVGSSFTSDKISYKIRHIYGGVTSEHRSFYRGQG